jgi:steroid delta-isomerase-like uncharacterized protein
MSSETNKAMSRRFLEEVFSKGKLEVVNEIFATNHSNEGPGALPNLPKGPEGVRQLVSYYRNAFPDTSMKVDEQVAEGNLVATRWTAQGTQKGEMVGTGIPVTGRPITVSGVSFDRFENGKIVESWGLFDQFGMLQQLGAIPAMGSQERSRK